MKRVLIIMGCMLLQLISVMAQLNDTTKLFAEMEKLQQLYKAQALSFDIRYTYASELHPEVMLDSLTGSMELDGRNYHYQLDNTETIANSRYNIILFKDDKIMYLARPATVVNEDPMSQMRMMTGTSGMKSCRMELKNSLKIFHIDFDTTGTCRELNITIDNRSGHLLTMRYVIKTALLMENTKATPDPAYGDYAIVETAFRNYKELAPGSVQFKEEDFFYKEGDEFKTTPAYSDYKIFTGSPNL